MAEPIRWGILGTGNIAHSFANGLADAPGAELVAVGSRSQRTADAFGDEFNVPRRYPDYQGLVDDPDVDVIYISTPHSYHRDNTLLCLRAGKAVLCEKPFAINAREAAEMIATAREQRRLLMEAVWTRFFPAMVRLRELLAEQVIGELRMLSADFGFRTKFNPSSRLFDKQLGGGALLDVGVYPVNLASMLFGRPEQIVSTAHLGETGVDEQSAMLFRYRNGEIAILSTAIRTNTPHEATIIGTEGQIRVEAPWWHPSRLTIVRGGKSPETIDVPYEGNGYNYEAVAMMEALRAGKTEVEIMPLDETLAVMETMDQIRGQWGLRYPMEG